MTTNNMAALEEALQPLLKDFMQSNAGQLISSCMISKKQYQGVLRQIFHHTRENPQLQALATVYFRGRQRNVIKMFYRHATSEIGHDQLALNDYQLLGGDIGAIPYENPLPATQALLAYGFYQIYNLNPIGYLGYLYFLEFTPTSIGADLLGGLAKAGIPDEAMTFLKDHTTIDVGHNKLMEGYIEELINSQQDIDTIVYGMKTTADLYLKMLDDAIAFEVNPYDTGWNWAELNADGITPKEFD